MGSTRVARDVTRDNCDSEEYANGGDECESVVRHEAKHHFLKHAHGCEDKARTRYQKSKAVSSDRRTIVTIVTPAIFARTIVVHVAEFVAQLREGLKHACDADSSAYGICQFRKF
jgi:hypothetical protein